MKLRNIVMIFGTLLLAMPAFASSYYDWDRYGSCYEWTPAGAVIQSAPADRCRDAVGSYYDWDRYGSCYEWTPVGAVIESAASQRCRYEAGSYYDWDSYGSCYEWTMAGNVIESAAADMCRRNVVNHPHHGAHFPGGGEHGDGHHSSIKGLYAYRAADQAVDLINNIKPHIPADEFQANLLPIKTNAGRVMAAAKNHKSTSPEVQALLKDMLNSMKSADPYIGRLLTIDSLFESARKLLTVQDTIKSLIKDPSANPNKLD